MDKEVVLTIVVCATQIALALIGTKMRKDIKAVRRQQSVHNLYLGQVRDHLNNPDAELPTMRRVQEQLGVPRHARS